MSVVSSKTTTAAAAAPQFAPSRRALLLGAAGAGAVAALGPAEAYGAGGPDVTPPVLLTEQATRRLLVLDPRRRVWDPAADPSVVRWQFSPLKDPDYADLAPDVSWVYPSESKARRHRGRTYVLTTASFGFVAVVAHPSGERYWGTAIGPGDDLFNPHSAEILPDGNVAVACSTGAIVRLYAASQGPRATRYAEAALKGAHGLHWDGSRRMLWAIGDDELVAYEVGGTPARPALRRTSAIGLPVGTPGRTPGGHDLFPVARRPGRLWVTTNAAVFQYDTARRVFLRDFAGAELISRKSVKCVGDDPRTGQVVTASPESGLGETWWTTTVSVHRPESRFELVDGGIYKARWWLPR
ncbi:hypothetical protein DCW30_09055 [Streptomyces alfalfae]|uniref:Tat pathway signal sequence domain protein n=1 Tax=Streptomyces alfalfae TaxID=1642299 RepID=A0ABM6GWW2_9ACTN|nr:DUF6528 family protein [Streptomyces alfalfae]APY87831.1 hypothetical protein A7J05_20865 [Streptomyces alfalfae]AYA18203.1 hypothetical protein D3X13_19955 [Streptomyces fradiae]RXX45526.1 hypothetical protein DCW30_09055 [Streptomyces alfalfae]RZM91742.1 hypothetical protein D4104_22785 [Streptomyces alfalfae]